MQQENLCIFTITLRERVTLIGKWDDNLNFENIECKMCIILTIYLKNLQDLNMK